MTIAEANAALAALGNRPSPDGLIARIAETALDRAAHEHPERGEDLYCLNLTSWMGERMGGVLVRLRDAEAERDALRERAVAAERALALRTCLVPGCLAQYDAIAAMTGEQPARPEWSAKGWLTLRVFPAGAHICPKHADIVTAHLPRRAPAREDRLRAVCACGGWSSPPLRWHRAVRGLWEEHLLGALDAVAETVADDGTCGDCATGKCHGTTPDDCGCDRHAASTPEADRG